MKKHCYRLFFSWSIRARKDRRRSQRVMTAPGYVFLRELSKRPSISYQWMKRRIKKKKEKNRKKKRNPRGVSVSRPSASNLVELTVLSVSSLDIAQSLLEPGPQTSINSYLARYIQSKDQDINSGFGWVSEVDGRNRNVRVVIIRAQKWWLGRRVAVSEWHKVLVKGTERLS